MRFRSFSARPVDPCERLTAVSTAPCSLSCPQRCGRPDYSGRSSKGEGDGPVENGFLPSEPLSWRTVWCNPQVSNLESKALNFCNVVAMLLSARIYSSHSRHGAPRPVLDMTCPMLIKRTCKGDAQAEKQTPLEQAKETRTEGGRETSPSQLTTSLILTGSLMV